MDRERTAAILDLFAEMKREASPAQRLLIDRMAVELMTTEPEPMKMADNLKHWLDLHAA